MRTALILGATGQDGGYLSELLVGKGYYVHGLARMHHRGHSEKPQAPLELPSANYSAIDGSVTDAGFLLKTICDIAPDEIYYLASNHELDFSVENYEKSRSVNLDGLAVVLSAMAESSRQSRLFYASSSNIFLGSDVNPQNEMTPHAPRTLYGFCKSAAMSLVDLYRRRFGLYACSGILYNHESPRRNDYFLPKKIVAAATAIKQGNETRLSIGDIGAVRDWGYAGDFVDAMWMMLQAGQPRDYVIGTGVTHTVEWVLNFVFSQLGLDWREHVVHDKTLIRANDASKLKADIARIRSELGWKPTTDFSKVLKMMIENVTSPPKFVEN